MLTDRQIRIINHALLVYYNEVTANLGLLETAKTRPLTGVEMMMLSKQLRFKPNGQQRNTKELLTKTKAWQLLKDELDVLVNQLKDE